MLLGLGAFLSLPVLAQNTKFSAGEPGGVVEKPVGSCNSAKGCRALEKACLKLKGHTYKPSNGGGICDDGKPKAATRKKGTTTLSAVGVNVNDAKCFSAALCTELRNTCQGDFEQKMPNYGVCKD
jgi:hypothetical protein